jgi:UDP-glucose 4-epimerase
MEIESILVTGGAGFIGSHLANRLLELGYSVTVVDNESTGLRQNVPHQADYFPGDVRKPEDLEKAFKRHIDAVFHIAGQASNVHSFADPMSDLTTNVIGTLNVLQACIAHKVPRILFASSMTVYGHPDLLPVPVTQLPRPISYYGITKYAAERYVMATAGRNDLDFEFNATAFRMFNVFGERQRLDNPYQGALGFFLGNVLREEPVTVHGDGEQTRDFIYIRDVVDAWMTALTSPTAYQKVFNLGCGKPISINRLVDEILGMNGQSRKTYPVVHGSVRPGDQRHMVADISQTSEILGWSPKTPFPEALQYTLTWAKEEFSRTMNGGDRVWR